MEGEVFSLFDIPIHRLTLSESLLAVLDSSQLAAIRVMFITAYSLALTQEDRCFRRCLQLSEYCLNSGRAINLAARFLGEPLMPTPIRQIDWVPALFDLIENGPKREKMSLFCIGGRPESLTTLPHVVQSRWPHIQLVGHQSSDLASEEGLMDTLEKVHPDILLLGLESPREEYFLCRHWHRIKLSGVKIAISGGEAIDSIAGTIPMTPRLSRALHLEWLLQMLLNPRKFYTRYLRGGSYFAWYVMKQKGMREQK